MLHAPQGRVRAEAQVEVRGRPLALLWRPEHLRKQVLNCYLAALGRARAERITRTFAIAVPGYRKDRSRFGAHLEGRRLLSFDVLRPRCFRSSLGLILG
jgi:hypothetical protein